MTYTEIITMYLYKNKYTISMKNAFSLHISTILYIHAEHFQNRFQQLIVSPSAIDLAHDSHRRSLFSVV